MCIAVCVLIWCTDHRYISCCPLSYLTQCIYTLLRCLGASNYWIFYPNKSESFCSVIIENYLLIWKIGSCTEGNVVNNLAELWVLLVLLLYTELLLFPQNGFGLCRQFITPYHCISCTDNRRNFTIFAIGFFD